MRGKHLSHLISNMLPLPYKHANDLKLKMQHQPKQNDPCVPQVIDLHICRPHRTSDHSSMQTFENSLIYFPPKACIIASCMTPTSNSRTIRASSYFCINASMPSPDTSSPRKRLMNKRIRVMSPTASFAWSARSPRKKGQCTPPQNARMLPDIHESSR